LFVRGRGSEPGRDLFGNGHGVVKESDDFNNVPGNIDLFLDLSDGSLQLGVYLRKALHGALGIPEPFIHHLADEDIDLRRAV